MFNTFKCLGQFLEKTLLLYSAYRIFTVIKRTKDLGAMTFHIFILVFGE